MAPKTKKSKGSKKSQGSPKEIKVPSAPGPAMMKRLALAGAPSADARVSAEVYPHIKAIYAQHFHEMAKMTLDSLKAANAKLKEKGKKLKYSLNYSFIDGLPVVISQKKAADLQTCLKKAQSSPSKKVSLKKCLIGPKAAFKKFLIVGSDDGSLKPVFTGAKPYRFRKEFLNALQYCVEQTVISVVEQAWAMLKGKAKTLSHKHFEEADIAFGGALKKKSKKSPKPKKSSKPKTKKSKGKKKSVEVVEEIIEMVEEKPKKKKSSKAKKAKSQKKSVKGTKAKTSPKKKKTKKSE